MHRKVLWILNSHFSEMEMKPVVQHYESQTFNIVNAKTLLMDYIESVFTEYHSQT